MTKKGFQITERDIEIIRFINEFGFCDIDHISKNFKLNKPRNYEIMRRLIEMKLVTHDYTAYSKGVYRVTVQGAKHTDFKRLRKIPKGRYEHQKVVLDVFFKLREIHPEARWVSERQLLKEKYSNGLGKPGHISDGILKFEDGKQIFIEVELSTKETNRLKKILGSYSRKENSEVWYYCNTETFTKFNKAAEKYRFIKTHHLDEFLP